MTPHDKAKFAGCHDCGQGAGATHRVWCPRYRDERTVIAKPDKALAEFLAMSDRDRRRVIKALKR